MITWKRITDSEFWILDAAGEKIMGPLATEEYADHALKTLSEEFSFTIKEYEEEWDGNFSKTYLLNKAADRVTDIFLRFGSINISRGDALKINNLMVNSYVSNMDIINREDELLWIEIKNMLEKLPSTNYQDVMK